LGGLHKTNKTSLETSERGKRRGGLRIGKGNKEGYNQKKVPRKRAGPFGGGREGPTGPGGKPRTGTITEKTKITRKERTVGTMPKTAHTPKDGD